MTTPHQPRPDSAYVVGDKYGSDQTQQSVKTAINNRDLASFKEAQVEWKDQWQNNSDRLAYVINGQNAQSQRLELIKDIDGFASAFMGQNWTVSPSTTVMIPFNGKLGPNKKADVTEDGRLVLKAGGLWRIDAQATLSGYTLNQTIIPIISPPYFTVLTSYDPIAPKFWLEVMNAQGQHLTVRACDTLPNVAVYGAGVLSVVNNPATTAFNHTFVLENMPPVDDPAAPDHWAYVRLTMRYEPIATGTFASATCKLSGGTKSSGLIASRWSRDVQNNYYTPTVPNGGNLG
ncbi:hypothetical protein NONI108955_20715 [Nocardia ninae]|uniref:Uncharacterized protein n=1 Tax=Nocardia ninae NBRC 108245 TaxID=1210091 RepID=A0A511MB99_9NOCA|nr:hypothetical protein [Nocardia ninae]GEM37378.1 hypothetical protein NN4_18970 [Nocardia ninae NBRC 108245]